MIQQKYVNEYIELYRSGKVKFNKERKMLIDYLESSVLNRNDLYFDDEMIENCIRFGEKWYFPLQPFQKFLIAFVFLFYKKNKRNFYRKFLWMLGRGGGKNGLMSVIIHFMTSELHGIPDFHVSVIANSEEQAKTSPDEIHRTIKRNETLQKAFKTTLTQTISKTTGSVIKYRTSNGETKDGLRDGMVVFDEIHQYASNKDVRVHISGLGKKPNPREFYLGTDGYLRDAYIDSMKEKAMKVLNGEARPNALFPFICKLNSKDEMNNPDNWELANPMLSEPRSGYAEGLYETILEEFYDLEDDPSNREEFITKRMNLPEVDLSRSVATWDEIVATNRPFPSLENRICIGGMDFSQVRDFTAVGLLFKDGEDYIWKSHSFAVKNFLDTTNLKVPIDEWAEQGLITIIDEPVINIKYVVEWFCEMREIYGLQTIVADNFRLDIVKKALEDEGFTLIYLKNPKAIQSKLAPRIESLFAKHNIIFGDNPLMRWYTQNVEVKINKDGNKEYLKKDQFRRKTDGFHAFVHSMFLADELLEEEMDFMLADIRF